MAKKINVKLILELRGSGMGRNAIARTRHISVNSVGDVSAVKNKTGKLPVSHPDSVLLCLNHIGSKIQMSYPHPVSMICCPHYFVDI